MPPHLSVDSGAAEMSFHQSPAVPLIGEISESDQSRDGEVGAVDMSEGESPVQRGAPEAHTWLRANLSAYMSQPRGDQDPNMWAN